jgi:hypothetical protein
MSRVERKPERKSAKVSPEKSEKVPQQPAEERILLDGSNGEQERQNEPRDRKIRRPGGRVLFDATIYPGEVPVKTIADPQEAIAELRRLQGTGTPRKPGRGKRRRN